MADIRVGRDRIVALGALHQRAGDHRKCADDGRFVLKPVLAAEARHRRSKTVDDRHPARSGKQVGKSREGAFARRPQACAHIGFAERAAGRAVPQPRGDALKARFCGELGDVLSGDDEFTALAIDVAQRGFSDGNPIQTDLALGELDVHGLISFHP